MSPEAPDDSGKPVLGRDMTSRGDDAEPPASMTPRYLSIALPDSAPMALPHGDEPGPLRVIAIAPRARAVAYLAGDSARTQFYVASLDDGTITPLPGSEDAHMLAFSPDGEWLAFVAAGELRKIAVSGGPVVRLAPLEVPIGVVWLSNDRILVSRKASDPRRRNRRCVPSGSSRMSRRHRDLTVDERGQVLYCHHHEVEGRIRPVIRTPDRVQR